MSNGRGIAETAAYIKGQQSPETEELRRKYAGKLPWQVRGEDPAAYDILYGQQGRQLAPSLADQSVVTDFLGNLAWTAGEELSLGALTIGDLYYRGAGREAFGVQEWEDNSWAGRVGGIAGQGIGFVSGVGLIGKGLKGIAKATGFGSKALTRGAGKKIRSETAETLNKIVGDVDDAVMNDFGEELYQAGTKAIKTGTDEAAAAFGRKAPKRDPFADFDLEATINKEFDDLMTESLQKGVNRGKFGDDAVQNLLHINNKEARDQIRSTVLKTSQEYTSENIPRALANMGVIRRMGDYAQIGGDMAYESVLLGIHGGLRNLVERGTADYFDIPDEHYERRAFVSDVLHGMRTGAALGLFRYIPGGAQVHIDPGSIRNLRLPKAHAGVIRNVTTAGQAIIRKYTGKKSTDYTPQQLQTMMRNIYYGSNKNTEFFRGVEGWTPRLVEDVRMLDNAVNVKALHKLYDHVGADISKNLIPMLRREVGRD